MDQGKPYWEMSRISLDGLGRYDRIFKEQKKRLLTQKAKTRNSTSTQKTKKPEFAPTPKPTTTIGKRHQKVDDIGEIELVGYKPSEYKAVRKQEPLRGRTAPAEFGCRDTFKDCHTPIQITKRFQGDPILSVPIRNKPFTSISETPKVRTRSMKRDVAVPIFDSLFDESIDQHENIDPWGYASNEKVVCKEVNINGVKIKVSRL